jgi:hypothetical protein
MSLHTYKVFASAISLTAATAKTVALIATPVTRKMKLKQITLGFDSVDAANTGVLVELVRYAADGTRTAFTPVAVDQSTPPALCTAGVNYSAEPTTPTVLDVLRMTPVGSTLILPFPPDDEPTANISTFHGIRLTSPQAQSNVSVSLLYDE